MSSWDAVELNGSSKNLDSSNSELSSFALSVFSLQRRPVMGEEGIVIILEFAVLRHH